MLTINGTKMPNPTKYKVGLSDLDSSDTNRTESGVLVRNRVRQGVYKIEAAWTVTSDKVAQLLSAVKPSKVSVKFFDPQSGATKTINAYVGDRSCEMKVCTTPNPGAATLWDVSFNLIEY